jgi:hypothetical protein
MAVAKEADLKLELMELYKYFYGLTKHPQSAAVLTLAYVWKTT